MMYRLGIDLGGTKIEGIILDSQEREIFRQRIPTEQEEGYDHIINRIKELYNIMVSTVGKKSYTCGIGTPGAVSPKTGLLKNSNTLCLNGKTFKQDLEKALNRQVAIENDANCFALAEALYGAGKNKNLVFGVILGTGCGGGIVYKKEVLSGLQAIAGEWGHSSIDPQGPDCYCGKQGCVETFISGGGVEQLYFNNFKIKKSFKQIARDYKRNQKNAVIIVKTFLQNFGRSIANLINILDPDIIVLGGGVSNFDLLYTDGIKEVKKNIFSDSLETPIVKHKLGDSAGVIGAALIGK